MIKELKLQCLYKVYLDTNTSIYSFLTKNEIKYQIIFIEANSYYKGTSFYDKICNVYSLFVEKESTQNEPKDIETKKTINEIVKFFFSNTENILIYQCETRDGRGLSRFRTFNYWFESCSIKDELVKIDKSIKDGFGVVHYTTLLYHKENTIKEYLETSHQEVLDSCEKE